MLAKDFEGRHFGHLLWLRELFYQWFDLIFNSRHFCWNLTFSIEYIDWLMLQAVVSVHTAVMEGNYMHITASDSSLALDNCVRYQVFAYMYVIVLLYNSAKCHQNRFRIKKVIVQTREWNFSQRVVYIMCSFDTEVCQSQYNMCNNVSQLCSFALAWDPGTDITLLHVQCEWRPTINS